MEKLICKIVSIYRNIKAYWMTKTKWGFNRVAIVLTSLLILGTITIKFNEKIAEKEVWIFAIVVGVIQPVIYLERDTKFIHFISKGKYDNPKQLLQNMTHLSYIYGIIISFSVEYMIYSFAYAIQTILGQEIQFPDIRILFCAIFFVFNFFYFLFHLYINPEGLEISYIKQRLQLYTVLGTTVSFILILINENGGITKFVTGILLDYLWINYFITKKENNLSKKGGS